MRSFSGSAPGFPVRSLPLADSHHLIAVSTSEKVGQALRELGQAYALIEQGKRSEAGRHAVRAYELLYFTG